MNMISNYVENRKERENKILQILERDTPVEVGKKLTGIIDGEYKVFNIPLEYIVFNHLNDRFASRRREYIAENNEDLKSDDIKSQEVISEFIWNSNEKRNKETLSDILVNKQREFGVITQDGRIIDGNRRARILKEIYYSEEGEHKNINKNEYRHFKAVVLPGNIDDREIQLLETSLQMGMDEKVDYNAIEKYLKINKLKNEVGLSYKEISAKIKSIKNEKEAEKMQHIYNLMCEYLVYIEAKDKFSLVEKMEDHFIKLSSTLIYYDAGKYNVTWNPVDNDIEELKAVAFNYIRAGYEGKDFRNLMGGQRDQKGIFANSDVWDKFKEKHYRLIDSIDEQIISKVKKNDFNSVEERESLYIKLAKKPIQNHLNSGVEALRNKLKSNQPKQLAEEALSKVDSIDMDFFIENYNKETYIILMELLDKINEMKDRITEDVFKKGK